MEIKKIDRAISEIESDLNFYSFLVPLNQEEERKFFFKNLNILFIYEISKNHNSNNNI